MALDTTISGLSSNSYVTMAEADAYFENSPYGAAWEGEEALLIYAALMLDCMVSWFGSKTITLQAREFPRTGLLELLRANSESYDYGLSGMGGDPYSNVIPQEIKNAQCELAMYYKANPSAPINTGTNVNKIEVGPIKLDMNGLKAGEVEMLPAIVQGMISKFGKPRRSGSPIFQARTNR